MTKVILRESGVMVCSRKIGKRKEATGQVKEKKGHTHGK